MQHTTPTIQQANDIATNVWEGEDDWIQCLGQYVRVFSDIEYMTFWLIRNYQPDEAIAAVSRGKDFKLRTEDCKRFVSAALKAKHQQLSADWSTFMNATLKAAEKRNAVLHNPLMISFYTNEAGEYTIRQEIALMRKEDHCITLDQVKEQLQALLALRATGHDLQFQSVQVMMVEPKKGQELGLNGRPIQE